jgi:hypothetical protein
MVLINFLILGTLSLKLSDLDSWCYSYHPIDVLLTQVKSWRIKGRPDALKHLDISGAKEMEFICLNSGYNINIGLLPDQLETLALSGVTFTRLLSTPRVRAFSYLTTLRLRSIQFDGCIQQFLKLPELKILSLSSVRFLLPDDQSSEDQSTTEILSELAFFQDISKLERLSLEYMPMNAAVCVVLQSISSLQSLAIDHCSIENFITRFTRSIAKRKLFLALNSLQINNSWPKGYDTPYTTFAQNCIRRRPNMEIVGNGNHY